MRRMRGSRITAHYAPLRSTMAPYELIGGERSLFDHCNNTVGKLYFFAFYGEVSEWLKEHAWKVCIR